MKIAALFLGIIFRLSIAVYGGVCLSSEPSNDASVSDNDTTTQNSQVSSSSPVEQQQSYPALLPLQLIAPPTAQAGLPFAEVSINLLNPGDRAPNALLRLIIHNKDFRHSEDQPVLSPENVSVEVLESGEWKPVLLGMVESSVMGAIGAEGVYTHHQRYQRDGFEIPAGLNKTWQLRLTFGLPGTYSLVAAVSPDNGSTHLAQPAHSIIVVQ